MDTLRYLFFWNLKSPEDNQWHPRVGQNTKTYPNNLPPLAKRIDIDAAIVDTAPFVAGAGGLAHISQIHAFGFTAPASVFRNVKTMTAMHRTVLLVTPLILACQVAQADYRYLIPRWAHERERQRSEEEVREHVLAGAGIGGISWAARIFFRLGARYWAPIDVVMGGALADLMHREYVKAHGGESPQ